MQAELLFLGTGGSSGIPVICCRCEVCQSPNPYNKRLRPAALITCNHKTLLIDAGPDLRFQALHHQINRLDGLLLTHSHFDHVAGLDELRAYYLFNRLPLPVLLSEPTHFELKRRYDYLFRERAPGISLTAQLEFQVLKDEEGSCKFLDFDIDYMRFEQAGMPVTGFRFGSLAYISDIRNYSKTIFQHLKGIKTLVISALRQKSSFMHLNFDEAIAFSRQTTAEATYFTHMSHEVEHLKDQALLPQNIFLAYDGLKIKFEF